MSNRPNIFISDVFNPLYDSLKNIIVENGEIGQLTVREDDSDIIISFAYNDKEDILEMSAMMKMITKFPKKKIVFLSWFHPLVDYDKYKHLFNPGNPACILMDANKYRILQLPINKDVLIGNILELTKLVIK
ncbi:MAG: hypothetical protein WC240_08745 [Bacilli bacterium]|jgi:hypothetical protein|nr:hypothetical protein [Bacteroidales bacterium]MDY0389138.1 hypothetical protein [Methanolobus sp.]